MKCEKCSSTVITVDGKFRCSNFPILCDYQIDVPIPDINGCNYIVFDLETSGLSASARIIEIAAVKVINGIVTEEYQSYINPHFFIGANITSLTGIKNENLLKARDAEVVIPEFLDWCGEIGTDFDFVVAHNGVSFDCRMLKREIRALKETLNDETNKRYQYTFNVVIDTMKMARKIFPKKKNIIPNHRQETLAKYYGITYTAHRALDDVKALQLIFEKMKTETDEDFRTYLK